MLPSDLPAQVFLHRPCDRPLLEVYGWTVVTGFARACSSVRATEGRLVARQCAAARLRFAPARSSRVLKVVRSGLLGGLIDSSVVVAGGGS